MDTPTLEFLAERIEGLERENRWLKRIGGLAVVGLLALITLGTNAIRSPREVSAEKFVLNDAYGRPRAKLEMKYDGPSFSLLNREGRDQAVLRSWEDGTSALNFLQGTDQSLSLSHSPTLGSSLSLIESNRRSRADLFVDTDGGSGLALHRYQWGAGLGMEPDGTSKLRFLDRTGTEISGVAVAPEGNIAAIGKGAAGSSAADDDEARAVTTDREERAESGCKPTKADDEEESQARAIQPIKLGATAGRRMFLAP